MPERDSRERDIILSPNEYAYVQDTTKGDIVLYVGPTKISLSNTERMVEYSSGRFLTLRSDEGSYGVNSFVLASSSQYIILENPSKDSTARAVKGSNSGIELQHGQKVVIPGPASFPLWPGQQATVIDGHELREDQYLVVRVYDAVAEGGKSVIGVEKIIHGTETKFYIPTTGLEVVPDEKKSYTRNAVILSDGEFCILLTPNGKRRYCRGPAVVFPEPTEEFLADALGKRNFSAFQVKRNTGLHLRVVRDLEIPANGPRDDGWIPPGKYPAGMELFVSDHEGFFFPSEDIEVIKEVTAIPVADKEGIYIRDIGTGKINTVAGPRNYLPDPTKVEIISRSLTSEIQKLYGLPTSESRKALSIYIPPSFAVLVTSNNKREVALGPQTRILDYDEDLEVLRLSTGKPKSDENPLSTCFLIVNGNKVSDIIKVKTSDHVDLEIYLSYRVSFVGNEADERVRWFNVNNYVSLLCDHAGSIVRAVVRVTPIEKLHAHGAEVIRTAILGEKKGEEKRAGRHFEENGMMIYDVEVLGISILDKEVDLTLTNAQRAAIKSEVQKKQDQMHLDNAKVQGFVKREMLESEMATIVKEIEREKLNFELSEAKTLGALELLNKETIGKAATSAEELKIHQTIEHQIHQQETDLEIQLLHEKVNAFKEQMNSLHPQLISLLRTLGDQQFTAEVTKNLSPLAILGGESVREVMERLLKSLPMTIKSGEE